MSSPTTVSTITYHFLSCRSSKSEIAPVHALSNEVFGIDPNTPDATHHSSLTEWLSRLSDPDSLLVYAATCSNAPSSTSISSPSPSARADSLVPVGFVCAHPRKGPFVRSSSPPKTKPNLHIWLAGVLPAYRGQAIFPTLVAHLNDHAVARGFDMMSICTYPNRFAKMYRILSTSGWEEKEWMENGEKVLFVREVDRGVNRDRCDD